MTDTNTTKVSESTNTFVNLGRGFQEKVMQAMIVDRQWAAHFVEVFDVDEHFEYAHLKLVAGEYINHFQQYKEFPSLDLLVNIVRDKLSSNDAALREHIVNFLKKVASNQDLSDLQWVKDKALTFCRQQQMKKALLKSVDLVAANKYEAVVEVVRKAISAGIEHTVGHEYNTDIDARYSITNRHTIPTGIPELDERHILNGGLGTGEVGIVVAPTSTGKTHVLVDFGCAALCAKKNVVHYSLELCERLIGIRYDSNLTDIPSSDCYDCKDKIKEFFAAQSDNIGRLIIKEYPTKSITVAAIRAHIEKLAFSNFRPDMLIVDYAGIMRASQKYDQPRFELISIIQELRGFAKEIDVPIWTALQSNKEGARSDYVDITNLAEAYGQGAEADFVIGLQRKPEQKATGFGTLYISKNRAGIDGINFKVHLDTSRSKLRVLTHGEAEQEVAEGGNSQTTASTSPNLAKTFNSILKDNKDLFRSNLKR